MKLKRLHLPLLLAVALIAFSPNPSFPAQTTIQGAGAIAPVLAFTNPFNLDFGELVIQTAGAAGSIALAPSGAVALSNATQIGVASRGSIDLTGRRGVAIIFTITSTPLTCDLTYIGSCTGTPSLTIVHDFTGQLSLVNCPGGGIRCTDTIFIGGTFGFSGIEEGRWNSTLSLTANYQ